MQKTANRLTLLIGMLKRLPWNHPIFRTVMPRPRLGAGQYGVQGGVATLPVEMAIPRWEWMKATGARSQRQWMRSTRDSVNKLVPLKPSAQVMDPYGKKPKGGIYTSWGRGSGQLSPLGGGVGTHVTVGGTGAAGIAGGLAARDIRGDKDFDVLKGELAQIPGEAAETTAKPLSVSAMVTGGAGGAAAGGLGSLLYGKLKHKPDLRRDVVWALVGAAAGTATGMMAKTSFQQEFEDNLTDYLEKKAGPLLSLLAAGGSVAAGAGIGAATTNYIKNKGEPAAEQEAQVTADQQRLADIEQKHKNLSEATAGAVQALASRQGEIAGAGTGAMTGAVGMGMGSAIYGKLSKKESLRRDLALALLGALGGGYLGAAAGRQV